MIHVAIDSDAGRIGPFWWFNSDTTPMTVDMPLMVENIDFGMLQRRRVVRWGTFGIGRHAKLTLEPIDD